MPQLSGNEPILGLNIYYKNMLSSSILHKNKEVLTRNGGGGLGRNVYMYMC
jgi:hypothetical protein